MRAIWLATTIATAAASYVLTAEVEKHNEAVRTNAVIEWDNFSFQSATNVLRTASEVIAERREHHPEFITNAVNILAESGDICKVFGHSWRGGRPGEGNGLVFADYHPNTTYRTCRICGDCQSQSLEWK